MNICLLTFLRIWHYVRSYCKLDYCVVRNQHVKKQEDLWWITRKNQVTMKKPGALFFMSWPIKEPETLVFLARSHTFPGFRWKKCFLLPWLALLQYGESRGHYWVQSVFSIQNIQIRVKEINRYNFPPIKGIQIQVAVVHAAVSCWHIFDSEITLQCKLQVER